MSQLPFQLLELNVISAQDLAPVSRNMRTYAVAWINPERKLRTRIDQQGQINPTWNDKFVFRVEDKFFDSDTSSVMIEIYALGWLRDIQVGAVRVLVSNLVPPSIRDIQGNSNRRFVALQIRRPSGRPQGILNMGVTLLDKTMRSMPLYTELSISAVGYRDLMDGKAYKNNLNSHDKGEKKGKEKEKGKLDENNDGKDDKPIETIKLWRSRSDRTDLNSTSIQKNLIPGGSVRNGSLTNSGMKGGSLVNASGSMVNGSEINGVPAKGGSVVSDLGPSPSIVAAAVARGLYPTQLPVPHQEGSSILGDWTAEESSVEGLKSKIDRWRMEVPRVYDRPNFQKANPQSSKRTTTTPRRRRSGSVGSVPGLFSCFGNAYGCEFTIVCGGNDNKKYLNRCDSSILMDSELDSDIHYRRR